MMLRGNVVETAMDSVGRNPSSQQAMSSIQQLDISFDPLSTVDPASRIVCACTIVTLSYYYTHFARDLLQ